MLFSIISTNLINFQMNGEYRFIAIQFLDNEIQKKRSNWIIQLNTYTLINVNKINKFVTNEDGYHFKLIVILIYLCTNLVNLWINLIDIISSVNPCKN
jgi:hypothetical protein